ncbi:MAG: hypothetical protein JKY76_03690 [Proteobacteria bacterium]|nr:hypothetical protein [Pseudomonadota bacterium]
MKKIIALSLSIFVCSHVDAAQYVFPENGQTAEQQNQDEYYCHSWATKQTGYDPTAIAQQSAPPKQQAKAQTGSGLRGGLRGAGRGWIIGEVIDGDSGKAAAIGGLIGGVRGRNNSKAEQADQNQQISHAQNAKQDDYFRARAACLEAKGYSVK